MSRRIVILTEGLTDPLTAKTAVCLLRYRPEQVVAVLDSTRAGATTDQTLGCGGDTPVIAALDQADGANTLVIGVAPPGGRLPAAMRQAVLDALGRGWTVEAGLHEFLCNDEQFTAAAQASGATLCDVRKNSERDVTTRQGIDESCLRVHTVGHDCSCGKMVTAVEVTRGLETRRLDAKFVATGQTGILVEGDGIPIDCVVADFINGAAEKLVKQNQHHQVMVIEGQGTLVHPRYSSVTLGLLHGSMPDALIMCYEVGRTQVHNMNHVTIPPLEKIIEIYEQMAGVMHPCKVIGLAMNSRKVDAKTADQQRREMRDRFGLPVCDVIRHGPDELVDAVIAHGRRIGKLGAS
ncbi:DUF1611 domain-containing protein [Planctomycetales bacterium ZRK34]|nr:DUF1611 domain-containing protein [Planctomycetales bacterium ZRK34]